MQVGRGGLRWGQLLATRRGLSDSIPGRLDPGTDNPEGWDREKVNQEHPHSFGAEAGSVGRGMLSSRLLRGGCQNQAGRATEHCRCGAEVLGS